MYTQQASHVPEDISIKTDTQHYQVKYSWENKVTDLETDQKRIARAERWGRFGDRKCPGCSIPLRAEDVQGVKLNHLHHLIPRGMPGCNYLVNMRLAHPACNSNLGKPPHPKAIPYVRAAGATNENLTGAQEVAYKFKPFFVKRVEDTLLANGKMSKAEAIFTIAREFFEMTRRGSSRTTERYLREFTEGPNAPWMIDPDSYGRRPRSGHLLLTNWASTFHVADRLQSVTDLLETDPLESVRDHER